MNRFIMTEAGRDHAFTVVSARIAFAGPDGAERSCKIQVVASHPDLPEDAVLWFAPLRGVSAPTFSLREDVIGTGAGFYLFEHSALEDVTLDLRHQNERWHLHLTGTLFGMGPETQTFRVSTDLDLCDDFDLECG